MSDELDLSQFKEIFISESKEKLALLNNQLVELEKNPKNVNIINEIFRIAHTLKGMSATMGYDTLTSLTHTMEDVLDKLRKGEVEATGNTVNVIFECFDYLEKMINEIELSDKTSFDISNILRSLEGIVAGNRPSEEKSNENSGGSLLNASEVKISSEQNSLKSEVPAGDEPSKAKLEKKTISSIRINISNLDAMMNLVGEMVINKSQLEQISKKHKIEELENALRQFGMIVIDLQESVLKTRMVSVSHVFDRYPRMVRDLAKKLDKEIDFEIAGSDIEIDRMLLDEINEPLMHILRNAVDHGIESPEMRENTGKYKKGKVILEAKRERGGVLITVSDDGKGLDRDIIENIAVEKGLVTKEDAGPMADEEIFLFVCNPGFSTKSEVTDVSGRGVGMDVVKALVDSFNGRLNIKSKKGEGSSVVLSLPLSMAILSALLVDIKGKVYAIPLNNITEIVNYEESNIKKIENKEVIILRDEILPLIRPDKVFKLHSNIDKYQTSGKFVLKVEAADKIAAFVVDDFLERKDIVLKTLSGIVKNSKGFSGATILGNGSVVLIIDVGSII